MKYPFDCITDLVFVEEEEIVPSDVILVPGGSHVKPMEMASELYHAGIAPYIIPSGGLNSKIEITEWEHLKRIGISLGVPDSAILREDQARNTFDNARNSWQVINERQLSVKNAVIVCKSFFARRALMTYQTVFPPNVSFRVKPDESRISRTNWYYSEAGISAVLNEAEKITKYFGHHIPNWVKQNEMV
ncbi:YdcF family protein [Paenibacillus sp. CF384]|uniref:YdcF family protein n=1 Tax=Paenibacillus sp. CF384 TaxID=1884382 RepID=UPI00089B3581|nr:YdcF family protein [Paenibacillus sp. CF384]SDW22375.1 DUF218 domain-containing protein [Paenibacillus sp. CF384]